MSDLANNYRKILRRNAVRVLWLCVFGLMLNFVLTYIVKLLGLPIWIDMTGTVVVAVLGGYIPSITIGFFTNVLTGIFINPTSVYYCVTSVIIAICTTFFYQRGWFKRFITIIPYFIIIPVITTFLDEILPTLIDGLQANGILLDFYYEVLDKTVTLTLALVILHFIPERIKQTLRMRFWQQRPLSNNDEKAVRNIHCRFISMRTKIVITLTATLIIISAIATLISFILYRNTMIAEYTADARNISQQVSYMIEPEKIQQFLEHGDNNPEYSVIKGKLEAIKATTPNVSFLYVCKMVDEGCIVVFELGSDMQKINSAGTLISFDKEFIPRVQHLLTSDDAKPMISHLKNEGWLLSVYVPIRNSAGSPESYVGTYINMEKVVASEISFLLQMIFLFTGFLIMVLFLVIWLVDYGIIFPINAIALRTKEYLFNNDNDTARNIARFRNLDIHTGDEIENLYSSLVKMIGNTNEYVMEINNQRSKVTRMQNSMIIVLADMVESRDENTGLHIHKTAEYVRIILEKMKELGLHSDFITDKYIENVVNSAPLHDIGKIKITDRILNKPGKLTAEEFEIMKTHAAVGGMIIEKVIKQVPNSSFLREAKAIATYHHEKWDGSGYPKGLSGTDIPFSARVMAVADVFDALVSLRVYKPPMTLDRAFSIIKEGSGNHFDPEIVEVFFAAKDRIIAAKKMFEDYEHQLEQEKSRAADTGELVI